ncbi:unnamed protein product [Merluccius merluccius]
MSRGVAPQPGPQLCPEEPHIRSMGWRGGRPGNPGVLVGKVKKVRAFETDFKARRMKGGSGFLLTRT